MRAALLALVITAAFSGSTTAQNRAANLVGSWQASGGGVGACTVELGNLNGLFGLTASSRLCLGQLGFLNGWKGEANGVSLLGLNGEVIGSFAVNGGELKGRMNDGTIISLTPASGQNLVSARSADCIHNPDHGYCADPSEVALPTAFPVAVKALHPLAIRQRPTAQSTSLGTIPDGQCFIIEGCTDTSEGAKCHIPEATGIPSGWASKHFIQDGTWFVGFQNFC
tara:strand:- start:74 stop:748 length:675 start_codon:yes stop_codon:yes gene_type:complete